MGSFNLTCGISGLPVVPGDPVKCFLLTKNRWYNGGEETIGGYDPCAFWVPRTPPIDMEYDDYGRCCEGQQIIKDLWMNGFQTDLIEQGVGNNSAHDLPTSKEMSWDDMMEAVSENRVFVHSKSPSNRLKNFVDEKEQRAEGVPGLKKVIDHLENKWQLIINKEYEGFYVDSIRPDVIRIRVAKFVDNDEAINMLKAVSDYLQEYSTVITKSTSRYNDIEMLVFPHPKSNHYLSLKDNEPEKLLISMIVVRKDIWDALKDMSIDSWMDEDTSLNAFLNSTKEYYKKYKEFLAKDPLTKSISLYLLGDLENKMMEGILSRFSHSFHHWNFSIREHLDIAIDKGLECDEIISNISELGRINFILSCLNKRWMPSFYGGQDREWNNYANFADIIQNVALKGKRQDDEDEEEWLEYQEWNGLLEE